MAAALLSPSFAWAADTGKVEPATDTASTTAVEVYTKEWAEKEISTLSTQIGTNATNNDTNTTNINGLTTRVNALESSKTDTALHISSSGDLIVGTKENQTVKDMEIRGKLTSGSISTGGITSTGDVTVAGKMAADGVTDETTKDGTYIKQNNTVGNNLVSLDTQVKANADAIAEKVNAADVYTKDETDQKVDAANTYTYRKVATEEKAREAADKALDDRITNVKEYLEKQTSDNYVSKADAAVQDGAIVKAANTIGENVTNLDAALAKETAARLGADAAQDKVIKQVNDNLVASVNTINKNVADGFTALNQADANEAAAREAKDNELNERITNEANGIHDEIKAGDKALDDRITNVKEYLEKQTSDTYVSKDDAAVQNGAIVKAANTIGENVTNLDAALAKETAARLGADKAQDKVIQQVNQNMVDGFNTINTNMANGFAALNAADAAEKEARIGADKKLAEAVNSGLSLRDDNVLQKNTTTVADDGTVTTSKSDANEMILNKGNKNQITLNEKGVKVGTNSSVMDADGIYTGGDTFDAAKAAMSSDGQIKGANGKFTVDASGNTTVTSLDAGTGTIQTKGDIYAKDATFSGDITAKDATLSGDLSAKDGTFSGDLSAKDGTFSGDVSAKDVTATGTLQGAEVTDGTATLKQGKLTGVKDIETEALHVNGDANVTGKLTTKDLEVTGEFNANTLKSRLDENNYTEIHGGNVTSKNLKVDKGVTRTSESSFDENGREEYVTDNDSRATVKVGANEISQTLDDKGDNPEKAASRVLSQNTNNKYEITDSVVEGNQSNVENRTADTTDSQISFKDDSGKVLNKSYITQNLKKVLMGVEEGDNKTTIEQDANNITNTAKNGTIKNDAKDLVNTATGNMTNTVGGEMKTTVKGNVTEDYKANLSTKVGGDETHAVTGNQTTTVSGNRTVNVKGTETENFNALKTNVKTDQKTSVGGNQTNIVGGDQQNTVSGSKTETVKGSVTEKYGSQVTTVDGDQSTHVGGNQSNVVAGNQTDTISGNKTETVKGAVSETYGSQTTKVNGDQSTTVTGKQTNSITGDQVNTIGGNLIDTIMGTSTTTVTGKVTEDYKSDLSTKVGGDETHAVTGNQTTTVSGNRTVNVKGTETENFNALVTSIKTDQKTSVGGNQTNIVGGDQQNTVSGSKTETVKGSVTEKYGSQATTVDGDQSTNIGGNQTTVVAKDQTNTVSGNKTETVKGAVNETYGSQSTTVNGNQSNTVKGTLTETVTGDVTEDYKANLSTKVGGNQTTTVTGDSSLSAKNITNKASEKITNQIGDGSAVKSEMTADGITNTAKGGTIYNKSKDILNEASGDILNFADGEIGNSATKITNLTGDNTVTSDTNGTTFENKAHSKAIEKGSVTKTTISGNTLETGKATMDYAEVMKDLGVRGNAAVDGNTTLGKEGAETTLTVNSTSTFNKDVTMKENATVGKDLTVKGKSNLIDDVTMKSNATVEKNLTVNGQSTFNDKVTITNGGLAVTGGTTTDKLHVTSTSQFDGAATFKDIVTMEKDLNVGGNAKVDGDVTAKSFKVGDKTYINEKGINANNQVIRNVGQGNISEGSTDAVSGGQLYETNTRVSGLETRMGTVETRVDKLDNKIDKVGANAAAMANLHPLEFDEDSKWNIAAAVGSSGSETASAVGVFYRPNENVMVNASAAMGTGENMFGGGVSLRLGHGGNKAKEAQMKAAAAENKELRAKVDDLTARMDALLSVLNPNMSKDFPDVPENHWAYEAVSRLAGNGIVEGYEDGKYHGERQMTRYEMAEIIYNALSKGAKAEKKLVEEFRPELQAMAAQKKA